VSNLEGRTVLVTGVSRRAGIGAAIAMRLGSAGASLFLTGWAPHDAEQSFTGGGDGGPVIAAELRAKGVRAQYQPFDLAEPTAPLALITAATDACGQIDALVLNHARSSRQNLMNVTAAELDQSFAVNARASLLLARYFVDQRRREAGGRIVVLTSGQYTGALLGELPYSASKAVLQQITRSLAVELAPRQITVNCVNPGPTDTGYATGEAYRKVKEGVPAGRWGRPDDAARLVAWLVSEEAEWVTGQTIAADGGWSARGTG
jgi:3-oxoacyl-[acyl-carrier protein] reductase